MWKKHFLVYIFFFGKNCIICAKTFFELFFNKKFCLEKKTIICDWDHSLCVKDILLVLIFRSDLKAGWECSGCLLVFCCCRCCESVWRLIGCLLQWRAITVENTEWLEFGNGRVKLGMLTLLCSEIKLRFFFDSLVVLNHSSHPLLLLFFVFYFLIKI